MSRSRTWSILERYFDLRDDTPITSPLGSIGTGGSDQVTGGIDARTAWMCDIGAALAGLDAAQREQIDLYYHAHRARDIAEQYRRNKTNDVYRESGKRDKLMTQRSASDWRRIADRHSKTLNNIIRREAYKTAMDRLEVSLPIVLLMGGWTSPCPGVDNSLTIG